MFFITVAIVSCGGSSGEAKRMESALEAAKKQFMPGAVSTTSDGYFMKATVNGEQWTATHMMPDEDTASNSRRIYGENDEASISFSVYIPGIAPGKTIAFSDEHAADFSPAGDGFFSGKKGRIEITAVTGDWLEGRFNMTATGRGSDKTYEIKDGVFRIKIR